MSSALTDSLDSLTISPANNTLGSLPTEVLLQILSDAAGPASGIILVAADGSETELLRADRESLSFTSKRFRGIIDTFGTPQSARSSLPKVHLCKDDGFMYFFDMNEAEVQSRIRRRIEAHERKSPEELEETVLDLDQADVYPHGWGLSRRNRFIRSNKNDIETLVINTASSSGAYAGNTCTTLKELLYWAQTSGKKGTLFPKLRRIVVTGTDEGTDVVSAEDGFWQDLAPSSTGVEDVDASPAERVLSAAQALATRCNVQGPLVIGRQQIVVSRSLSGPATFNSSGYNRA